jgi:hypothetical protein
MTIEPHKHAATIRLHGGEHVALTAAEAERVFDELWKLGWQLKGAVTAAAKLKRVDSWTLLHGEDVLNADETAAFREALRRTGGAAV